MHAKTWFPSNEMHESPNLTNEPLCSKGWLLCAHTKQKNAKCKQSASMCFRAFRGRSSHFEGLKLYYDVDILCCA